MGIENREGIISIKKANRCFTSGHFFHTVPFLSYAMHNFALEFVFVFPRTRFSRRRPRCGREADQRMYSQRPTFGEENKDEAKSAWKQGGGGGWLRMSRRNWRINCRLMPILLP